MSSSIIRHKAITMKPKPLTGMIKTSNCKQHQMLPSAHTLRSMTCRSKPRAIAANTMEMLVRQQRMSVKFLNAHLFRASESVLRVIER